jgi:hypothetical protein
MVQRLIRPPKHRLGDRSALRLQAGPRRLKSPEQFIRRGPFDPSSLENLDSLAARFGGCRIESDPAEGIEFDLAACVIRRQPKKALSETNQIRFRF